MKTILLLSSATLAAHLSAQQGPARSADHPLPPTVEVATTRYETNLPARQPLSAAIPTSAPAAPARAPAARPAGPQRLAAADTLPSSVLFDRPHGDELWALGHHWKASFDGRGFTFIPFFGSAAPRNFPLRLELAGASLGGAPLPLVDGKPQLDGTTVRTDRGGLVETVATSLREVEQSFVFSQLPHRGAIAVDIALTTELLANVTAGGVRFANEHGVVAYEKAVAVDAAGAMLPLAIEWDGDSAHITIPAAFVEQAQLPLVLDPLVTTNPGISSPPSNLAYQREPDVATLQAPDLSLVVWQRQWSATDQDCFARVLDANLAWAANQTVIDFSGLNWVNPRVASNRSVRNFLVVAQIDLQGPATWVGGRTVGDNGVAGSVIDIERGGVVGLPGNNFRPDVGGDPYLGPGAYYNVVWEHETAPGNRDIHYKLVRADGTLVTTNPSVLANLPENESFPSISKSNGEVDWHVAYQRQWPLAPFDQDIWEARITYFGSIAVPAQVIAGTVLDELRPCVSSLALPQGFVGGANALVAYERVSVGQSDIFCAVIAYTGGVFGGTSGVFNLSASEALGVFAGRNQIFPEVDTDGVRFAVGYSEFNGSDYDTFMSTLAFDPSTATFRLDEERVLLGGTTGADDYWTRISAYHSGGGQPNPRYIVAGADIALNNIPVFEYGGYQAGQFFSVFPTQCGALTITPAGTPAIGQTVSFTVNTALPSGTVFGTPGLVPLTSLGCNCFLGVAGGVIFGNPLQVPIPPNVTLVGAGFSVQGFGVSGANCLGFLDLTDTIDFTIR